MMDRARWDYIQDLFHRAADLSESDRERFLEEACAGDPELGKRVRAMIEEDARGASLLDRAVAQVAGRILDRPPMEEIGRYRIRGVLGEGGMGVVYLAERKDLKNLVALKLLRDAWLSPARIQRFAAEQRTLAQLDHPSIARLYDADTLPDGTPWFVMEYVDGVPLTEYCREHGLSVEERLKLFRSVCEAVRYAHERSIVHRDLKPSNILVKKDGSVRLLDFGIAKHLDSGALGALSGDQTRTGMRLMTPAYAAPEQVRGQSATAQTDVYSLGVILYELLAGRLPFDLSMKTPAEAASTITSEEPAKPSAAVGSRGGVWTDLDALCLKAMEKDPRRRYVSVEALIRDVDHYLNHQPLEARKEWFGYAFGKFARRNWRTMTVTAAILALVALASALTLRLEKSVSKPGPQARTVAVLPFQNTGTDHSVDYLGVAICSEIARMLDYARSLTVRPFTVSRSYADPQTAARALHVANIVTGQFLKTGDRLQVTLEMVDAGPDAAGTRLLWRDAFNVAADDPIALEAAVSSRIRSSLGPVLGASDFGKTPAVRPKNREAYDLFLRSIVLPFGNVREARPMLERSVKLDPGFAPAWGQLASVCTGAYWYSKAGDEAVQCAHQALERAAQLDPENVWTNYTKAVELVETHDLTGAYRAARELLRRRSDNPLAHLGVAYVMRYAGLLEDSEHECEAAIQLDPLDAGLRSCANAFLERGDYPRARDFLRLDLGTEFERAISMDVLLREGKEKEAFDARPATIPAWAGFPLLIAYLDHRPANEIAAMAREMKPVHDPEMDYFAGAHLAYAGQAEPALTLLRAAVDGGYCSYPAVDTDPLWANVRTNTGFAAIRSAGIACQQDFLKSRDH